MEDFLAYRDRYNAASTPAEARKVARGPRSRGNPGLSQTSHETTFEAAWLVDGCGYSRLEVADALGYGGANKRSTRSTGKRHLDAGRKYLNDLGALPWTLWAEGEVPPEWWHSPKFSTAINLWYGLIVLKRPLIRRFRRLAHELANTQRVLDGQPTMPLADDLRERTGP